MSWRCVSFLASFWQLFGQFLATFWQLFGLFWRGVASLLSILAVAKQGVYSKEYTVRDIPRALLVGLLIKVLGLHLMDPGMDRRAAVFSSILGLPPHAVIIWARRRNLSVILEKKSVTRNLSLPKVDLLRSFDAPRLRVRVFEG